MLKGFSKFESFVNESRFFSYLRLWVNRGNKASICIKDVSGKIRVRFPVTLGVVFLLFCPLILGGLSILAWIARWTVELKINT